MLLAKLDGPSFSDLYKIHEIVEHSGHGKSAMGSAGISKAAMSRFTRTANHQRPADLNLGTGPQAHQRLWTISLGTGLSCFADHSISISETIFLVRECPLPTVSDRTIGHATCTLTVASSSQAKSGSQLNYGRSRYARTQRKACEPGSHVNPPGDLPNLRDHLPLW